MNHTPGPWKVGEIHRDTVIADAKYSCPERNSGHDDVEYYGGLCIAESILPENRPLIAAAPDLEAVVLAMLAAHRGQLPSEAADQFGGGCGCPLCRMGVAAIAKTEGRS